MKTHVFQASLMGDGKPVTACSNLRIDSLGTLRPVGTHPTLGSAGDTPVFLHHEPDGSHTLFVINHTELKAVSGDVSTTVGHLPERPLSVVTAADGSLLLMLPDRAVSLCRDGAASAWTLRDMPHLHSPLALTAVDAPIINVSVDAVPLLGSYDAHSVTLVSADLARLGSALSAAYRSLDILAASLGEYVQPMLGCYRLVDNANREIYRSAPVVLGPSCGINGLESLTSTLVGASSVAPSRLQATPFRVALRLDCDPADSVSMALLKAAERVEVLLTPQLHPVDSSCRPGYRFEHSSTASRLAFFLPGTSVDMTPQPHILAPVVTALMAHLDDALSPAFTVSADDACFTALGATKLLSRHSIPAFESERRKVQAVVSKSLAPALDTSAGRLVTLCSAPHSFTASAATVAGSTVLWADVTTRLFHGFSPCEMARSVVHGVGRSAHSRVVVCNDEAVESSAPPSVAPSSLSPLLCYPLPSASRIRIEASLADVGDDACCSVDFPLSTLPGCRYAFYINPSLKPLTVDGNHASEALPMPALSAGVKRHPGAVVSADISSPLVPRHALVAASSAVNAVVTARRDVNGWSFSHRRFYLLTDEGVMSVSVNSDFRISAPALLYAGSAPGAYAVTSSAFIAVVGGALVAFNGGKARRVIASGVTDVGFSTRYDEVWVKVAGAIRVYTTDLNAFYTRPINDISSLYTLDGRLYYSRSDSRLYDASVELPASQPVRWVSRLSLPGRQRAVALECPLQGSFVSGAFSLLADGGPGVPYSLPVLTLTLNGPINYPLTAHVLAPPRPFITADFNASVSLDFSLSNTILNTRTYDC